MQTILIISQHSQIELYLRTKTFDELVSLYPQNVSSWDGVTKPRPNWGSAWYKKGDNGMARMFAEDWDTSG